ncbi:MAG: alpha/beta fold hydrolase [Bacteroidia bacterium]
MLNYQKAGQGRRKIIFIHSNSQSLESWSELMKIHILNLNFKLIAIDLPGHGDSFKSSDAQKDYTLKGLAGHLKECLTGFEEEEYILVASSLGSNLVGELGAELKPCKGVVLLAPSAIGYNLKVENIIKPNPNVSALFMLQPAFEQIELFVNDSGYNLTESLKDLIRDSFRKTDPNFRAVLGESIGKQEYSDELTLLEKSGIPMAVFFGREDKFCFTDYLDKVPFPKWRNKTHLIEQSGHFPQLDQPLALSKLIKEFAEDCFVAQ